ncbi:MAG: zinc-dependent peptidase [Acidobacteria bacterium]|nr:zinc-dependent peptidase [Acidobacteriota bacterium]
MRAGPPAPCCTHERLHLRTRQVDAQRRARLDRGGAAAGEPSDFLSPSLARSGLGWPRRRGGVQPRHPTAAAAQAAPRRPVSTSVGGRPAPVRTLLPGLGAGGADPLPPENPGLPRREAGDWHRHYGGRHRPRPDRCQRRHSDLRLPGLGVGADQRGAEFFAVATEYFFEKPGVMERKHPELYAMLSRIFRQDLATGKNDARGRLEPKPALRPQLSLPPAAAARSTRSAA